MQSKVSQVEKTKTMLPSMLVSATYDGPNKLAVLKFYEPTEQKLFLWKDETEHKPYCFSKLSPDELDFLQERDDVIKIETVKKYDLIQDKEIEMSKIIVDNPLVIGGNNTQSIRNQI
ncbi:MAG: DNA mismatch repair protein MutH, partial [Candidatus Nitrosopumilus limneticus]|nr:DNA mismatch repair protein MutH [Candidatus Nitrosopumilus limneticus]